MFSSNYKRNKLFHFLFAFMVPFLSNSFLMHQIVENGGGNAEDKTDLIIEKVKAAVEIPIKDLNEKIKSIQEKSNGSEATQKAIDELSKAVIKQGEVLALIKNENTGLGQFGQILISPTTAILTVQETGDDHVSNIGIFGNLGSNSILLSQRNFANTDSSQIRLHTSLIEFSGEVATVPFNYKFPLTSPSSGEVLGWVSANQLGWVTPGGSSIVNRGFNIGNGNIVVAVGLASRALVVDFNCNIISWTFTSTNITGSMSVDIIRKNGAIPVYPTDSIVGAGVKPNLSSAKYAKSAPSGWTSTALAAGDVLQIFINSNTLITAATLTLELQPI